MGHELIAALTESFRKEGTGGNNTVVIEVPSNGGAYTQTPDRVEHRGGVTVIHTKRLIHR